LAGNQDEKRTVVSKTFFQVDRLLGMLISLLLSILFMTPVNTGTLQFEVANIRDTRGAIRIGIYNKASDFPDEKKVYLNRILAPQKGALTLEIPDLPHGEYAIAVYHDLNGNGRLDKNMFGVPTEPYGFTGSAKGKWGSPRFGEASFTFPLSRQPLTVSLYKWEEL
jgi:uncharacterized protein (DUF2141 family)